MFPCLYIAKTYDELQSNLYIYWISLCMQYINHHHRNTWFFWKLYTRILSSSTPEITLYRRSWQLARLWTAHVHEHFLYFLLKVSNFSHRISIRASDLAVLSVNPFQGKFNDHRTFKTKLQQTVFPYFHMIPNKANWNVCFINIM